MNKKILSIFVLVLTLSLTTQTSASLTFTTDAITGTTASSIDLGSGNTLSLQTTGNGAINLGSGLLTSTGSATFGGIIKGLNVYEDTVLNTALGSNTLNRAVTGDANTAVGQSTLTSVTTGRSNSAFGAQSMSSLTTGSSNTAMGISSLNHVLSSSSSTGIGNAALFSATTGGSNTSVGSSSLRLVTTGSNNVGVGNSTGYMSGENPTTSVNGLTTGSNLTFIGYKSGLGSPTQRTNSTAIGSEAYVDADNTVVLGDENITDVLAGSTALATVKAGAVQLTTKADPVCSVGTRGQFWFLANGSGVKDTVNVCAKDAGDSYAWRVIY